MIALYQVRCLALILLAQGTHAFADAESDALQRDVNQKNAQVSQLNSDLSNARSEEANFRSQQDSLSSQVSGANNDVASATNRLSAAQTSQAGPVAAQDGLQQQLAIALGNKSQSESLLQDATAEQTAASGKLAAVKAQAVSTKAEIEALVAQGADQTSQLSKLTAASDQQKLDLADAQAVSQAAPAKIRSLVAQAGTLRGSGRTCSAFEISRNRVRTAFHCIDGVGPADLKAWSFNGGDGRKRTVVKASVIDSLHDGVVLDLASDDNDYVELAAAPNRMLAVRLMDYDRLTGAVILSDECHIISLDILSGEIRHDCASQSGSSGSALIQNGLIVGMHLGRFADEKVAVILDSSGRRAILSVIHGLEPEYDCASDCRSSATHNVNYPCPTFKNPRRTCSQGVFEPVEFSACEAARNSSCAANAAAADLARLKNSLRAESGRLGATVSNLSDDLSATRARSAELRNVVNGLASTLVATRNTASDLVNSAVDAEARTVRLVASLIEFKEAIATAKQLEQNAISDEAKIRAGVSNISAEIAVSSKDIQANLAKIKELQNQIARSEDSLANVRQQISLAQPILAGNKAVSSIVRSITTPIIKGQRDLALDLSLRGLESAVFADLGHLVTAEMKVFFHVVAADLVDTYRLLRNPKSILDGHPDQAPLPPDASMILNQRMCLQRASARVEAYKSDVAVLGLATWPGKVPQIGLADLTNASRVLARQVQALQAGVAEIALNDSCVGLGLETPLQEALTDATEWSQWTSKLRLSLISQRI